MSSRQIYGIGLTGKNYPQKSATLKNWGLLEGSKLIWAILRLFGISS